MFRVRGLAAALLLALLPLLPLRGETVTAAAASSLSYALPELAAEFERETGHHLRISYSSSGNLTRQILQGAPFAIFLAADERHPRLLLEQGWARTLAPYARGTLCLFLGHGRRQLSCESAPSCLHRALRRGQLQRLAIASPAHAPYGVAARRLLQRTGLWQELQGHLALAHSAAHAAQYVTSGAAQAGLVPTALGRDPALRKRGRCLPIPGAEQEALLHVAALPREAGDAARQLFRWLRSPQAQSILERHGFLPPGTGQ